MAPKTATTSQCRSHRHSSENTDTGSRNTSLGIYRVVTHQLNLYSCDARRTQHARGIWSAPDNTKDFFVSFGTALVRPRCGHTSSRSGRERRYYPLKWSCTNKQHCRGRHLIYLRVCGRISSKCCQITPTSLAEPGNEYGRYLAPSAYSRFVHSGTAAFISGKVRPRSKRQRKSNKCLFVNSEQSL